eukprot:scaffold192542_cov35-Tisochrysis_lutea.AAC.2
MLRFLLIASSEFVSSSARGSVASTEAICDQCKRYTSHTPGGCRSLSRWRKVKHNPFLESCREVQRPGHVSLGRHAASTSSPSQRHETILPPTERHGDAE